MEYELSPYPPSLFEAKDRLHKPDKAQLVEAIRNYVTPTCLRRSQLLITTF